MSRQSWLFTGFWFWLGIAAGAHASGERTAVGHLPIPDECLETYHQGALLFASTLDKSPEERTKIWAEQMDTWKGQCQLFGLQGLIANRLELKRNLIVTYWLDQDAARDEAPAVKQNITLEAKARLCNLGLDDDDLEGELAYGGPEFQATFPHIIRSWKDAAKTKGKALIWGRFIFTSGGDQNRGYTLYDYARNEQGALILDSDGNPETTDGSYGRQVALVYGWARRVVDEYDQQAKSQGFFNRALGFDDSFIWTWFIGKTAREIRENAYPDQIAGYLNMAEGLNLAGPKLQIFSDLESHLLQNQNASLARDAQVLDEMRSGVIAGAVLAPLILSCGAGVAATLPMLSLQTSDGVALVAAATATIWVTRTAYLTGQQEGLDRVNGQDFTWSGLLDHALEEGIASLPIADMVPVGCLTVAQGLRFLLDGHAALKILPRVARSVIDRGARRSFAQWMKSRYTKDPAVWGAMWRQSLIYIGTDAAVRELLPGDRPLIELDNGFVLDWGVLGIESQQLVKNLLTPIVLNTDSQSARFLLNNVISLAASFLSEAAFSQKLTPKDAAFDLTYADGVSFWVQEGNRAMLEATEKVDSSLGHRELVLLSLQLVKSLTVDSALKDYLRNQFTQGAAPSLSEVRGFLSNRYGLDYSSLSDGNLKDGILDFLAATDPGSINSEPATLAPDSP